jgi:hypothetical protein
VSDFAASEVYSDDFDSDDDGSGTATATAYESNLISEAMKVVLGPFPSPPLLVLLQLVRWYRLIALVS